MLLNGIEINGNFNSYSLFGSFRQFPVFSRIFSHFLAFSRIF